LLILAACSNVAPTPEHAALTQIDGQTSLLGTRQTDGEAVLVLYQNLISPEDSTGGRVRNWFGAALVQPSGTGWEFIFSAAGPYGMAMGQGYISHVSGETSSSQTGNYAFVAGQVFSPDVVSVRAEFANGRVVSENVRDNVYGLVGADLGSVCAVEALDADGTVLRRIGFPTPDC